MIPEKDLIDLARSWLAQDPDPETAEELKELIDSGRIDQLQSRFSTRLSFGTAGLRGELGAGPNRMNRVVVAQAAAGIARYLKRNYIDPKVVIGYDARKNSDRFALDSAEILAGFGVKVQLFSTLAATPLVSFAVRELGCSLGIMVTASHNPPRDNGYKVYDHSGSQIVSPTDNAIATEIENFAAAESVAELARSNGFESVADSVRERYVSSIANLVDKSSQVEKLKIVYSAMHGVGASFITDIFTKASLPKPIQVRSQSQPDGTFPTVAFPNPEEPGAMDHSLQTASEAKADLVLVNDPDADRLAIAFQTHTGSYRTLSGDELGLILGEELARKAKEQGQNGNLACSIVSSSALRQVAKHYGLGFEQTLTGFKWIARVENLIFGYEEALGYCVNAQAVRDKDGLSAAVVVANIAGRLKLAGETLSDHLLQLSERYGHFATGQISIRFEGINQVQELMIAIRSNPPAQLAGLPVTVTDLANGFEKLPATDALRLELSDGRRVIIRPSGTEPKLKCYLQAVSKSAEESKELLAELDSQMRQLLG
jgi:phosphomannomutase